MAAAWVAGAQRACCSGFVATESDSSGSETADDAAADVMRARGGDGGAPARARSALYCCMLLTIVQQRHTHMGKSS